MCRGYHRRRLEELRLTRLVMTEIRNTTRAPKQPWIAETEILSLPGDSLPESTAPETPEDVEALWAALDARDADMLA